MWEYLLHSSEHSSTTAAHQHESAGHDESARNSGNHELNAMEGDDAGLGRHGLNEEPDAMEAGDGEPDAMEAASTVNVRVAGQTHQTNQTNCDMQTAVSTQLAPGSGNLARGRRCYYYPICQHEITFCGGARKGKCKEVNAGNIELPADFDEQKKKRKLEEDRIRKQEAYRNKVAKHDTNNTE